MIAKTYILDNLARLDRLYNFSKTREGIFFSKLAIIELCGWIEISMDDIVMRCAKRNVANQTNLRHIEKSVIGRNFGFEYDRNFRNMLIQIVGLKHVEKLENSVDAATFQKLKSALGFLKPMRDSAAHTYLKKVTVTLDAPSVTKARFLDIYIGLSEIERLLRLMNL